MKTPYLRALLLVLALAVLFVGTYFFTQKPSLPTAPRSNTTNIAPAVSNAVTSSSTSSVSAPAVRAAAGVVGKKVIFEQPSLSAPAGNIFVKRKPAPGTFYVIQWQLNPNTKDGLDIPVTWKVGDKTGFYPTGDVAAQQVGMSDIYGSTAAQVQGDTIGIYLNAKDLVNGSAENKLGIFPAYNLPKSLAVMPFSDPTQALVGSVEMQVPTAVDAHKNTSDTYITYDIVLRDTVSGAEVCYGAGIFFNGHTDVKWGNIHTDTQTQNIVFGSPLMQGNEFITILKGSALHQGVPWIGYKTFSFGITYAQFEKVLSAARAQYPQLSTDPAKYVLENSHINSELHYGSASTELGLSFKHYTLAQVSADQLPL